MVCRIEIVPEVMDWLEDLRQPDPLAARLVDEAVSALASKGASLGAPFVVRLGSVWNLPEALDFWYQDRLDRLREVRRAMVAADDELAAAGGHGAVQVRRARSCARSTTGCSETRTCSAPGRRG